MFFSQVSVIDERISLLASEMQGFMAGCRQMAEKISQLSSMVEPLYAHVYAHVSSASAGLRPGAVAARVAELNGARLAPASSMALDSVAAGVAALSVAAPPPAGAAAAASAARPADRS